MNDNKLVWTKLKKNKKFVSKGFQHFRDIILSRVEYLTFREKFCIIKETDRELLAILNNKQGTRAVHTLDYVHKFPSRKNTLTILDQLHLTLRTLWVGCAVKEHYDERRKNMIRVIK
jgi:hypothetical protein